MNLVLMRIRSPQMAIHIQRMHIFLMKIRINSSLTSLRMWVILLKFNRKMWIWARRRLLPQQLKMSIMAGDHGFNKKGTWLMRMSLQK